MTRDIKLRLPAELADKIKALAKDEDRTVNAYMTRIIKKHIEELSK